ncbi:MAG TPA: AAA family ATPase [Steroidobacteraceae bacterium]|nr:AAA family ATPase [Steroidobacteraceae bacterium]
MVDGARPALFITAEVNSSAQIKRLEQEYALRGELDSAWAARPVALTRNASHATLTLEDPGGETLESLLDGAMQPELFLRVAIAIARAIQRTHERGLIHKDVKPANVLVDVAHDAAWLTGFGLASRLARMSQQPDAPEMIAGTLAYMAPEQTGWMNRSVDARSDLYSFGVICYEMLTGVLPFTADDPLEWIHCHIARQAIAPDKRSATVPAQLAAIVMRLLSKTAEERYQTAAGLAADLERCLAQLRRQGTIELFVLGTQDASGRLVIPEKLYGRSRQLDLLLNEFERVVAEGATRFVLVSGYAGVGKSAVVNELHKALVPPRGLFASGKFDQFKRDIPYATLGQAFQSLMRRLLAQNEIELARWRDALREALGQNGQLVVNLVPELELIMGVQPATVELSAQDAKHRFQRVLQAFLGVFARAEHPLALFLDDLQWIDAATLELLEELSSRTEDLCLMLIGAYRDNEVDETHPLVRAFEVIRRADAPIEEIKLAPLSIADVSQMLIDCLRCEPQRAASLAKLVHVKTEGNPFFAIQFITSIADEGLLTFDPRAARWDWDPERILAKGYSDNVADLMVLKLNRLPPRCRQALQQLACLGNNVEREQLALMYEGSREQIDEDLREAVRDRLVLPSERAYRFLHDRVQEAAYSSIPECERAATHLRIGRMLAASTPAAQIEDSVFEIVSQLNRGAALIASAEERARVAELNLIAGKRALASVAHASALGYFAAGLAMLSEKDWVEHYRLVFDLELNRARSEFLTVDSAAELRLEMLATRATDLADLAAVVHVQVALFNVQSRSDRAVAICLAYLQRIGVNWSGHPGDEKIVEEYELLRQRIAGYDIRAFIELPAMTDPDLLRMMRILGSLTAAANWVDANLMHLSLLRMANLSLEHGLNEESSIAFMFLTLLLGPRFGDFQTGYLFGQLGLDVIDKRGLHRYKTRVYTSYGTLVNTWLRPFRENYLYAQRGYESGLETGDFTWGAYAARGRAVSRYACGDPLDEVEAELENCLAFSRKVKFPSNVWIAAMQLRFVRLLRGLTPSFTSLSDPEFDEEAFERNFPTGSRPLHDVVKYWMLKAQTRFLADDLAAALAAVVRAESFWELTIPNPEYAQFVLYAALTHAACFDAALPADRPGHLDAVERGHRKHAAWAQDCPENFRSGEALIGAEIARIEGRELDAERLYEAAIRSARENDFVPYEAVAQELAGRFHAARGFETIRDAYLRNARANYLRWGAHGKVRHFDQKYPHLAAPMQASGSAHTIGAPMEQLDLATVMRMSQAVSAEIEFDRLIEILMRMALEHAGAQRGLLILPRRDAMRIEAEAVTRADSVEVRRPQMLRIDSTVLPESVFQFVMRTRETVLLHDAMSQEPFSSDEYVRLNSSRSILCLPIIKQTQLIGVLFLENNLASAVFTPARIAMLRLLVSQAATSLENARLYMKWKDADAFLAQAQRLSHTGSFSWCPSEDEIVYSQEAYRIFAMTPSDELTLESTLQYIHPDDVQRVRQVSTEISRTGKDFELENRLKLPDGSIRHLKVVGHRFIGDRGEERFMGAVMDVTAFKEAEERLRKAQAELADMARQTEMGELASLIAHEITQPLAAIVTNADSCLLWLAKDQPNIANAKKAAERIVKNGHHAADVIRSIRAQARKAAAELLMLDLNRLLEDTLELMRPDLQRRAIALEVCLDSALLSIKGDATQLQQVVVNLVSNGVDAIEARTLSPRRLRVSTHRDDSCAIVAVEDSGIGIDQAVAARIFEPMFTTKAQGMGLGLSICRSIIESHGGRLWVEPRPGGGSIFRFSIPEAV